MAKALADRLADVSGIADGTGTEKAKPSAAIKPAVPGVQVQVRRASGEECEPDDIGEITLSYTFYPVRDPAPKPLAQPPRPAKSITTAARANARTNLPSPHRLSARIPAPAGLTGQPERYRSGHNGADSKSDGRVIPARGFESHPLRHQLSY